MRAAIIVERVRVRFLMFQPGRLENRWPGDICREAERKSIRMLGKDLFSNEMAAFGEIRYLCSGIMSIAGRIANLI